MTLCAERAKNVLKAWTAGDRARIRELSAPQGNTRMSADEQERMELLASIGAGLRSRGMDADAPATAVSIRLLRHLASARN